MTGIFSAIQLFSAALLHLTPRLQESFWREREREQFRSSSSLLESSENFNRQIYTFKMEIVLGILVSSNFFSRLLKFESFGKPLYMLEIVTLSSLASVLLATFYWPFAL